MSVSRPVALTRITTNDIAPLEAFRSNTRENILREEQEARRVKAEQDAEVPVARKHGKGLTEGDNEVPDIPKNNLGLVIPALGLVAFIAALDQTIVATALPTIAGDLKATPSQYSWVGTSYLLSQTVMTPINGRVTDIIGRKPTLYGAIVVLLVFSALCGSAKSIEWLIVARAFAGVGGGSIMGMSLIVVSDIVPLHKRAAYQGYMGVAWGGAAALGPILGGVLTQKASWRWCFYINLPTCGISLVLLALTLKLNPRKAYTFAELKRTFDFLGLFLILTAATLLVLGFSAAADDGFAIPRVYGLIIGGAVLLVASIAHFLTTKRIAMVPARMLKIRTTVAFMTGSFLQSLMLVPVSYLLPQFCSRFADPALSTLV